MLNQFPCKPILKVLTISHETIERDTRLERMITTVFGIPFYRSSGTNSFYQSTWFPFYGLFPNGTYCKPSVYDETLPDIFFDLFRPLSAYDLANINLPIRFKSLPLLLISSLLGGGLWDSKLGQRLCVELKSLYPSFFLKAPYLTICAPSNTYQDGQVIEINNWIKASSMVAEIKQTKNRFPTCLQSLMKQMRSPLTIGDDIEEKPELKRKILN